LRRLDAGSRRAADKLGCAQLRQFENVRRQFDTDFNEYNNMTPLPRKYRLIYWASLTVACIDILYGARYALFLAPERAPPTEALFREFAPSGVLILDTVPLFVTFIFQRIQFIRWYSVAAVSILCLAGANYHNDGLTNFWAWGPWCLLNGALFLGLRRAQFFRPPMRADLPPPQPAPYGEIFYDRFIVPIKTITTG